MLRLDFEESRGEPDGRNSIAASGGRPTRLGHCFDCLVEHERLSGRHGTNGAPGADQRSRAELPTDSEHICATAFPHFFLI
jgi:hypothetical protein